MRLIDADALVDTLSVDPIGCAGCPEPEFMDELIDILDTAPTVEPTGDLISRADAVSLVIKAIHGTDNEEIKNYLFSGLRRQMWSLPSADAVDVNEVTIHYKPYPSAEAESNDLIIKGAKGIKDGLYNIKDGKLFQYKAKGGTVRTYQIIKGGDDK